MEPQAPQVICGTPGSLGHCGTQAPQVIVAPNHYDLSTVEPSMFGHVVVAGGLMSLQPVNIMR